MVDLQLGKIGIAASGSTAIDATTVLNDGEEKRVKASGIKAESENKWITLIQNAGLTYEAERFCRISSEKRK